jgi:ATP-binding cassette subfamily B protein
VSASESGAVPAGAVIGRPNAGAQLAETMMAAADRRPKGRDLRPLRNLLPFLARHKLEAAVAGVFLILAAAATLSITGAARVLVDGGFRKGTTEAINDYFLLLVLNAILLAGFTAGRFYFVTRLGERVVADIRQSLFRHVLTLDHAYYLQVRPGEVMSRLTTDLAVVETLVGASISVAMRNLLILIGALGVLMYVSVTLTGLVILLLALIMAPLFLFGRRVRTLTITAQDRFAEAVGYAGESLDALDTVQAFNREATVAGRFSRAVDVAFAASQQRVKARSVMTALVIALTFTGVMGVLWLGSRAVVDGRMSGGALVQFVFLSVIAAGSVGSLSESWGEVQKASGAMQRIAELLARRPEISAPAAPTPLPDPPRGEVAFENVTFNYPGREDAPALTDFSLRVAPGETVALVGPSGGGKSTVFRLLLRFYDPQGGAVRLDGVDLRQADPEAVRARLALVAQDAGLLSGSGADNIRFGREDATEEQIRDAARHAEALEFLEKLPGGLDGALGDRARKLSGGQRQRLAIARAFVRDAPVLLLDEATSALDAESERLVQHAIEEAMQGRTTLVIAHRLATVLRADRIVVIEGGRVVDEGTHDELVRRGGLYARLAELQFGARVP